MTAVPRPAPVRADRIDSAPAAREPGGAARVYAAQFFFLGALSLPISVVLLTGLPRDETLFSLALVVAAVAGAMTGVLTRHGPHSPWTWPIAALDAIACLTFSAAAPGAGFSVLTVLPVAWIAMFHELRATVIAVALAATGLGVAQIGSSWVNDLPLGRGVTATICTTLLVVFCVVAVRLRNRRAAAHRTLLHQQTRLLGRALERVSVQEEVLAGVLDSVEFAVVTLGPDGSLDTSNRAARALTALLGVPSPASLVDGPLYAEDRQTPLTPGELPVSRARAGEAVDGQVVWLGHPGETRAAASVSIRRLGEGPSGRLVMILRDVTGEIEETEARDEMVAAISHELRTPLTSVIGYLEMAMEDNDVAPPTRKMLDVAMNNTERVLAISSDVLAARSRTPRTALTLSLEPCRPADIARSAIEAMRPLAITRYISLVPGPLSDATVVADPLRLRQVVDNLLSNAIKYNVHGGRVDVHLTAGPDGVELSVSDTGRGMSPEDTERLFTRFYRTESARASSVQGTGLGLSITREIVELHGGSIHVESALDVGTTITVRLPHDPATAGSPGPVQEDP